jgi:hypothetical protein
MRRSCMRRVFRGIGVFAVVVVVAGSVEAGPRQNREGEGPRMIDDPLTRVVKIVKKAVRSLGDAVVTPRP